MTRATPLAILLAITLLSAPAYAHSYCIYVSTPLSPPMGFGWIAWSSWIALIGLNAGLAWFLKRRWRAVALATLGAIAGGCIYLLAGRACAGAHTGPPVGLGKPCPIFWGFGWDRVGYEFVTWNLLGFAFCSIFSAAFMHLREIRIARFVVWLPVCGVLGFLSLGDHYPLIALIIIVGLATALFRKRGLTLQLCRIIPANAIIYMICTLPFIQKGAITHGWCGAYVRMECSRRLENLDCHLTRYALAHDSRLPIATNIAQLMAELEPIIAEDVTRFSESPFTCPMGAAYERNPKPYTWNPRFSGMSLTDAQLPTKENAFTCPYHHDTSHLWTNIEQCREGETALGSSPPTTQAH